MVVDDGSSPRLRGTCQLGLGRVAEGWFIPAPAGNIVLASSKTKSEPVHPRACGEHFAPQAHPAVAHGSSPRLRGTSTGPQPARRQFRFIPAPAGNITSGAATNSRTVRSPRLYADELSISNRRFIPAPAGNICNLCANRFIPAPAGNMLRFSPVTIRIGSSPRLRGTFQHKYVASFGKTESGSSPRLRGTSLDNRRQYLPFIPAPANGRWGRDQLIESVHPRACGEHSRTSTRNLETSTARFIPAPAGNITRLATKRLELRFIPAPAGTSEQLVDQAPCGSSPRLRGTFQGSLPRSLHQHRFIPAPAGNI